MAEILIKAIDANHLNPVKDKSGCYKRGDVVVVMPDGHEWGKSEGPPKYIIIKVPGMTKEEAEQYIESEKDTPSDPKFPADILTRRKFRFQIDIIPQAQKDELESLGVATMTKIQAEGFLMDKTIS
jgi:hypothetical protein